MRTAYAQGALDDLVSDRIPDVPGVAPTGLPEAIRPLIAGLVADMQLGIQATKAAEAAATLFIKANMWPTGGAEIPGTDLLALLTTVPGVGAVTALGWLAEVTDPKRFLHAKQVAAFAGCDPSLKVSAGKTTSHVRRAGNLRLHQALLYAASGVLRKPADKLGQWGKSIAGRHKKGGYRKACGAVARRIATALWYVHSKAEPFSYEQYTFTQPTVVRAEKLDNFLKPRAVLLLKAEGIHSSSQLAEAYYKGTLGGIYGLGGQSIAEIKDWIGRNTVKGNHLPEPERSASVPGAKQRKSYTLNSALQFTKKERNGKVDSNASSQSNHASGPGNKAGGKARAKAQRQGSGSGRRQVK